MNTNVDAKRVLIYGDSLVYGKASGKNQRLDVKTRFTGIVQDELGSSFEIIEEGLRARTLVGENGFFKNRDGLTQFYGIVGSHFPLDLVVLILGTNDCNAKSTVKDEAIRGALITYGDILNEWADFLDAPLPQLLIVAPPLIDESNYDGGAQKIFGPGANSRVIKLPELFRSATERQGVDFLDLQKICYPAPGDGVHLDTVGNKLVAVALEEKIRKILE